MYIHSRTSNFTPSEPIYHNICTGRNMGTKFMWKISNLCHILSEMSWKVGTINSGFISQLILNYVFVYADPGPVTALNVTSHPTAIALIVTWQPPTDPNRLPVKGYKVQYRKLPNGRWSNPKTTQKNGYNVTSLRLKPETTYEVQVWAFSSIGEDPLSKRTDSGTTGGRESLLQ